ncbi:MAG: hypothetical protein IPI67_09150 [Myxococcales bacterium]|nr:hypothetical protein [Myxococcales bacterium]
MKRRRPPQPKLRIASLGLACAVLAPIATGCVVATDGEVELVDDSELAAAAAPAGGYEFGKDTEERRHAVPIEKNAKWKVVYSVPLRDLGPDERVAVRGEVQLTVCQQSNMGGGSPCTRVTPFDPKYEVKVILGDSKDDASGPDLSDTRDMTCTHLKHHCALSVAEAISHGMHGNHFANLVVAAVDVATNGHDVMIVDDHHGGLYVTRIGKGANEKGKTSEGHDVSGGWMKLDMENSGPRKPHVTLQATLKHAKPGDVVGVDALIEAQTHGGGGKPPGCSGARDPLITHQVFVSKHANDPAGSKLATVTAKNGTNCRIGDACSYRKSAALRLPKDTPSTVYVSVVSSGGRSCSAPNDEWRLGAGSKLELNRLR